MHPYAFRHEKVECASLLAYGPALMTGAFACHSSVAVSQAVSCTCFHRCALELSMPDSVARAASFSRYRDCTKGGVLGLLAVMQKAGLVPNVITYNAAISACEKGEQWQQALGFWR